MWLHCWCNAYLLAKLVLVVFHINLLHNVLWQIENMWVLCWNLDQFYIIRSLYNLSILLTHQFITIPRDQVVNCAHIIFLLENDNYCALSFLGGDHKYVNFFGQSGWGSHKQSSRSHGSQQMRIGCWEGQPTNL